MMTILPVPDTGVNTKQMEFIADDFAFILITIVVVALFGIFTANKLKQRYYAII